MRPFCFRLEPLLHLHLAARDACRVQLAQTIAKQQRLQTELAAVEQRMCQQRQNDRELRRSPAFSLDLLRKSESHRQQFVAEQTRISAAALAIAAQVEACQQSLAAAERKFQAVARLRAARLVEHQRALLREESTLADEAAGRAFRRAV